MTTETVPAPARAVPRSKRIREINGLRGVALTIVVLFHLFGHGRVSGGVDVFLTVSGFLLVMSLGRALSEDRPLGILARWGRTFARLAPSATLVLIAVTVASFTVFSPWMRGQTLLEVVSTALYVENWQLIETQLAYGAAGPETSPLQHFWSLSVQAQFFLGFPVATWLMALIIRHRRARIIAFWILLGAATAASFAFAWQLSLVDPRVAYFHTGARFWELGVGGLLAGVVIAGRALPAPLRAVSGWAGLAMVLASGFLFDGAVSYPGPAALVPVGGALLVILSANGGSGSPSPILSSRSLDIVDRLSYGLYLWHWPILIAYYAITRNDAIGWAGALLVLTLAFVFTIATLAIASPLTRGAIARGTRTALALAVVAVVLASAPAAGAYGVVSLRSASSVAPNDCAGAAALDPTRPECADAGSDGGFTPSLEGLPDDDAGRDECWSRLNTRDVKVCALGSEDDDALRILAVGDSHNSVWIDVYDRIATAHGWRIDAASRAGCQWVAPDTPVYGQTDESVAGCVVWREAINERAASGDYDAILTTASSRSAFRAESPDQTDEEFHTEVILEAWAHRASDETPILVLRDNPIFPEGSLDCIADDAARAAGECSLPRSEALLDTGYDEAVAQTENAQTIDLSDLQCGLRRCDMVVGGVVMTRDGAHLTATYAATLAPYLDRALVRILG